MLKDKIRGISVGLALTAVALGAPVHAQSGDPIKVGAVLSMSGPGAAFGTAMRNAIQVTEEAINEAGGIKGRPLAIVFYDDRTDPSEAARGVTQLINSDQVVAIVGAGTGGNTLAAGPIAQRLRVPMVSPVGTTPVTSKDNSFFPWVFRSAVNERVQLSMILETIAAAGKKKVGIVYQEDAYGKTGADLITSMSETLGLDVVGKVSAAYTATDLSPAATRLREAGADAVLMQVSIASLGAAFMKASKAVGLEATIYGGAGLALRSFVESVDASANGLRMLSTGNLVYRPTESEKELQDLLTEGEFAMQGWAELVGAAGLQTVVAAIEKVEGDITGPAIRDSLEMLCDFRTYLRGTACMNEDHESRRGDSLVLVEINDQKMLPVEGK